MMPDVMNMGVNWGTESPPGGAGSCLMQLDGTFYNASCEQSAHFSCEGKPIANDMTTAYVFFFNIILYVNEIFESELILSTHSNNINMFFNRGYDLLSSLGDG